MSKQTAQMGGARPRLELATAMSDPAAASGKMMWKDKYGTRKGELGKNVLVSEGAKSPF